MIDIVKLRKAKDMNQQELAQTSGVSQQLLCMIERGQRNMSVRVAKRIAPVLGVNWYDFFDEKEGENEKAQDAQESGKNRPIGHEEGEREL